MAEKNGDAITAALRLLSYRPRSERELGERLAEKGFSEEETASALGYLTGAGYIDDKRFAVSLAESRVRNKGWGPAKIAADLAKKGISRETIKTALADIAPAEEDAARAALAKWARKNEAAAPIAGKVFERAFRHLKARGFGPAVIMKVLGSTGAVDE
ncbi:MAG: regulatory protein RecX [Deltaproteobacteria bacterium]|nr:regulatory protein RecX [Deltaproteobacteria bacterium]